MRTYDYEHTVGFEETNLVGNVYFARYVSWQGRCRELFLLDHAPTVLEELADDLRLVTTRVACEYYSELQALDRVTIRMTLDRLTQGRVAMAFEYLRADQLVARGTQEIACLRVRGDGHIPVPVPEALREALAPYDAAAA